MAKSQLKACGPTRGRLKARMMGMGSGKWIAKARKRGQLVTKKSK
jgi:hypothetical protein